MRTDAEHAAGELIDEILRESGLKQAELARRAGMPRSVLNAYERGHRQPSVQALTRIAAAAGLELQVCRPADQTELEHAGNVLAQVLDLAESLPRRRRGALAYPPLKRLAA
jgi:transcriptional regulator with XRE-family HTH domain